MSELAASQVHQLIEGGAMGKSPGSYLKETRIFLSIPIIGNNAYNLYKYLGNFCSKKQLFAQDDA